MRRTIESLGPEELLLQLGEEAAELAQACLKLRRALDKKNPTPKDSSACLDNVVEEIADVRLCSKVLINCLEEIVPDTSDKFRNDILMLMRFKYERWLQRLNNEVEE